MTNAEALSPPPSPPKRKVVRRVPRKIKEDPSLPVLFKDMRLTHPEDELHLNALHCFVRSKLLEVVVLKEQNKIEKEINSNNPTDTAKESGEETPNIVGIRCVWCGPLSRQERGKGHAMSTFFPKSVGEIYRGVCTWQRIHFPVCEHMPEDCKIEYKLRKERDVTRGRKSHWIKSAYDLGLRNVDSERSGLTYKPGSPYELEKVLKCEVDPGSRPKGSCSKKSRSSPEIERGPDNAPRAPAVVPSAFAGGNEFELFGTDFDRTLEESKDAVTTTKREERAF